MNRHSTGRPFIKSVFEEFCYDNNGKNIICQRDTPYCNEVENLQIPQEKDLCRNLKGNAQSLYRQKSKKQNSK